MTRDVSDEQPDSGRTERDEVIDVAGNGGHREISCRDIEAMDVRQRSRQQRRLNLACCFHLALHGDELGFLTEHVRHDAVAERNDEDEDANWFQVDVGHDWPTQVLVDDAEQHCHRRQPDRARLQGCAQVVSELPQVRESDRRPKKNERGVEGHGGARPLEKDVGSDRSDRIYGMELPHAPDPLLPAWAYHRFNGHDDRYVDGVGHERAEVARRSWWGYPVSPLRRVYQRAV